MEIEAGSRALKNIQKVLDSGYDVILSFAINGYIRGKIANDLAKFDGDSSKVILATPYDYERIIEKLSA